MDVVREVFETLDILAKENDISLVIEGLDQLPVIYGDERRLYNAFYNLVNNAIPEVPRGGFITVSGGVDPEHDAVTISVADTGGGMPPEVCERLFSARAVTTKRGGTGLGTKIVKDVVDAHQAQITVSSEIGRGTTFQIRLPIDPMRVRESRVP
jgi:signal transduction histidine kinase